MNDERVEAWLTENAGNIADWARVHNVVQANVRSILAICATNRFGAVEDIVEARIDQAVSSLAQASGNDSESVAQIRSWLDLIRFPSIADESS